MRKDVTGRLGGFDQIGLTARGALSASSQSGITLVGTMLMLCLVLIAVFMTLLVHPEVHQIAAAKAQHLTLLGFAGITAAGSKKSGTEEKKPAKIRELESNLKALAKELEEGQAEMASGPVSQERGEELEAKAQEAEDIQEHIKQYNRIARINKGLREVDKVTLPGEDGDGSRTKRLKTTFGHLFVSSDAFKKWRVHKDGWSGKVALKSRFGSRTVNLSGDEAREFERKAFDAANLSDLGSDAIVQVDRDPEIVKYQEPEILTIRDMLNTVQTNSDSVKFVRHTLTDRAAATVARAGLKPFLRVEMDTDTATIETIAVLSKVTEQDISDAPRLVGLINGEMSLDIKVEEERQLAWGTGTNELLGLFDPTSGVAEFNRAVGGDTLIDSIRRMRTDLRKLRVNPNFVAIDPLDWEQIELEKGSDEQYIWGLIADIRGPRIWSLRVVESDAMTNQETGERRTLMGDGVRGATVYDRQQTELAIGLMEDDFARNLRTMRAEERLGFAIKRAYAFEYIQTAEPES